MGFRVLAFVAQTGNWRRREVTEGEFVSSQSPGGARLRLTGFSSQNYITDSGHLMSPSSEPRSRVSPGLLRVWQIGRSRELPTSSLPNNSSRPAAGVSTFNFGRLGFPAAIPTASRTYRIAVVGQGPSRYTKPCARACSWRALCGSFARAVSLLPVSSS